MESPVTLLIVLGVATHVAVLRRIDSVEYGPKLALAVVFGPATIFLGLYLLISSTFVQAIFQTTIWCSSYVFGILASMTIYRLFFHPLKSYPGPVFGKLIQWHYVWKIGAKKDQHRYLERLHEKYGEYVRTGPNTISIADPEIVDLAFGPGTKFTKSNWYHQGLPMTSLQQMTDVHLHDRRRKHGWDKVRV